MREFDDDYGRHWRASVGRESYGAQVLLFERVETGAVMKTPMAASTWVAAEGELAEHSDQSLRIELGHATTWEDTSGLPGQGPEPPQ